MNRSSHLTCNSWCKLEMTKSQLKAKLLSKRPLQQPKKEQKSRKVQKSQQKPQKSLKQWLRKLPLQKLLYHCRL